MAKFQINSKVPIDNICLDSSPKPGGGQRRITLKFADWNSKTQPQIETANERLIKVTAAHNTRDRQSTVSIETVQNAKGVVDIVGKSNANEIRLRVTVGEVTNHDNCYYDLFAELLGRSEDPMKLWVYQRALASKNNTLPNRREWDRLLADQPLKQITDPDHPARWNCGAALDRFGRSYFGKDHMSVANNTLYYETPRSDKIADLNFNKERLARGVYRMRNLLSKNTAIRVFAVHHDGFTVKNGIIQATGKTHFLTIVGADLNDHFLTIDPWPAGSRLMYSSGIFGRVDSAFIGLLKFDGNTISSDASAQRGNHNYTILAGP